jgi:hypothetical protein
VESKWKNYHIITFPGQSLSKTLEEAMDLSQDRLILELELRRGYGAFGGIGLVVIMGQIMHCHLLSVVLRTYKSSLQK